MDQTIDFPPRKENYIVWILVKFKVFAENAIAFFNIQIINIYFLKNGKQEHHEHYI